MSYIYESPDKGETVYKRKFGAPIATRTLVEESKRPYTNGPVKQEESELDQARKVSKTWSMEQD